MALKSYIYNKIPSKLSKKYIEQSIWSLILDSSRYEIVDEAVTFLEPIVRFWKILNVNGPYDNVRFRDPLRYSIRAAESTILNELTIFEIFFQKNVTFQLSSCEEFDKGYIK